MKPLLIVVTGRPGSGKTTLAGRIGGDWRLPLVSRDRIKEGRAHTARAGLPEGENLAATNIFFETLALLLDRGVSCVAEAAFQHKLWAARLPALMEKADTRLLVCRAGAALARERFSARARRDPAFTRVHGDAPPPGEYEEPRLDAPTFFVDTADGYDPPVERLREMIFAGRE